MRLYLLRHATAVPRGTPGFTRDADRPLTEAGRREARAVAKGLKRLRKSPDLILTSPYRRAQETAEQAARVFGRSVPVETADALRAEASPEDAAGALAAFRRAEAVLAVGHEPHLSTWLGWLVAGRGGLRCTFKKAGVACVELERVPPAAGSGTLRWLATPRHLMLIGDTG
jgi:phosphohistidine phosphatase